MGKKERHPFLKRKKKNLFLTKTNKKLKKEKNKGMNYLHY